jgi:hypothetical protein
VYYPIDILYNVLVRRSDKTVPFYELKIWEIWEKSSVESWLSRPTHSDYFDIWVLLGKGLNYVATHISTSSCHQNLFDFWTFRSRPLFILAFNLLRSVWHLSKSSRSLLKRREINWIWSFEFWGIWTEENWIRKWRTILKRLFLHLIIPVAADLVLNFIVTFDIELNQLILFFLRDCCKSCHSRFE